MSAPYADFEIAFDPPANGAYPVRITLEDGARFRETLTLPLDDPAYLAIQPKLEYPDPGSPVSEDEILGLGALLYKSLFKGEVRAAYQAALASAATKGQMLRIKLEIEPEQVEAAGIPWEFAADDAGFPLATDHSFCRFLPRNAPLPALPVPADQTLTLLLGSALPKELAADYPLDIDAEINGIKQALAPLAEQGRLKIIDAPHLTGIKLQRAIREQKPHLFHFIGHGILEGDTGALVLEKDDGSQQNLSGRQLAITLRNSSVRLVVLNACKTGAVVTRLLRGIAPALMSANVPAVVAMQSSVRDDAGRAFAEEFYRALAAGSPIDGCVAEGRKAVIACGLGNLDWGLATLYMRAPGGMLFDGLGGVAAPPATEQPAAAQSTVAPEPKAAPTQSATGGSLITSVEGANTITGSTFTISNNAGQAPAAPQKRPLTKNELEECAHLEKLLEHYRRSLRILEEQVAQVGDQNALIGQVNSISEFKTKIAAAEQRLAHYASIRI
ncbi:MAG TPA: CHAT domain-containing protein [Herpetosiphonaceae bacterium]